MEAPSGVGNPHAIHVSARRAGWCETRAIHCRGVCGVCGALGAFVRQLHALAHAHSGLLMIHERCDSLVEHVARERARELVGLELEAAGVSEVRDSRA